MVWMFLIGLFVLSIGHAIVIEDYETALVSFGGLGVIIAAFFYWRNRPQPKSQVIYPSNAAPPAYNNNIGYRWRQLEARRALRRKLRRYGYTNLGADEAAQILPMALSQDELALLSEIDDHDDFDDFDDDGDDGDDSDSD